MIRIMVIDDHPIVRAEIGAQLRADPALEVVSSLGTTTEMARELQLARPQVVLVDHGPPSFDGIQCCWSLLNRRADLRVLVMTGTPKPAVTLAAFDAGASGVVVKGASAELLRAAVRAVAAGGVFVDPRVAGAVVTTALAASVSGPGDVTLTMESRA